MKKYTLSVIGCGNMAQAILRALYGEKAQADLRKRDIGLEITVSDPDSRKLDMLPFPARKTIDNSEAVNNADYVLLSVKPQIAPEALKELQLRNKTILSIMAGVTVQTLCKWTGSEKIVRIMPNLNARVCLSYNAYTCTGLSAEQEEFVRILLRSFGVAARISENRFDAITGLTGSAPAFVFMFIQALIDEGIAQGFDTATAREMALSVIMGSTETARISAANLGELIESVCSKGGTTIEGVKHLHATEFEENIRTAVKKSIERAKELGKA
ncbi:MAG: pyrroline-5-carboxylate reductase [Clostridia bacterium]|nr:pyrroline-5-carboxylate reductase [Clostridia bacterium]